jgi:hypothetical protein
MQWSPAAPWHNTSITAYHMEADLQGAGPPPVPSFINGIRFKRDYIGDELKELQQRKLDPPQYEIRMLTEG